MTNEREARRPSHATAYAAARLSPNARTASTVAPATGMSGIICIIVGCALAVAGLVYGVRSTRRMRPFGEQ